MKTQLRKRYYCDYCKKAGGQAGHMRTHELHCTLNPNRVCRMCGEIEGTSIELSTLIALMPNAEDYKKPSGIVGFEAGYVIDGLDEAVEGAIKKARMLTDCPLCIFSALRQTGLTQYIHNELFDLKKELAEAWKAINDERNQIYAY